MIRIKIFLSLLLIIFGSISLAAPPTIQFVDAEVIDVIRVLSAGAGLDLVLSGDTASVKNKKTTISLHDLSPAEALEQVLKNNGFSYEKQGRVLLVSCLPGDLRSSAYKDEVIRVPLKHLSAVRAAELLSRANPGALFQPGEKSSSLLIRAKDGEIAGLKRILSELDQPAPQILIESRVVEVTRSDSVKLGITYGSGAFKFITDKTSGQTTPAENLTSVVNALIADGRAKVVASPRIATLDNQEALINIGSRIPYAVPVSSSGGATQWSVDYLDAGVKLKITPQLGEGGEITTLIQPEVSSIAEWRTTAAGDFPVISTRNASAVVRVKDGETIVVGGLLSESERENVSRLPLLGYLPGLGAFFRNTSREKEETELVFLITPKVI